MSTNPQDSAFPVVISEISSEAHVGLTKREFFAALLYACGNDDFSALNAIRSADVLIKELNDNP